MSNWVILPRSTPRWVLLTCCPIALVVWPSLKYFFPSRHSQQARSPCWWTGRVPPRWSPVDPSSAWSWTGRDSSASWGPARTSWRGTSSSTTASSPSPSEFPPSLPLSLPPPALPFLPPSLPTLPPFLLPQGPPMQICFIFLFLLFSWRTCIHTRVPTRDHLNAVCYFSYWFFFVYILKILLTLLW